MDISVIPEGMYCYEYTGEVNSYGMPTRSYCPYWDLNLDHHDQDNGYCHYLGCGDWDDEGLSLLWDQCKECGVNL